MYLLETSTFQLHRFISDEVPPYVILSHTWGDGEVLFQDIERPRSHYQQLKGFSKIDKCCALARSDGWKYVWIDNCCIDQKSSAELSEAINSMYRWYWDAVVCYAYLADVSVSTGSTESPRKKLKLHQSRWFTRGWTLQELLAPQLLIFYDRDWIEIGTKRSLQHSISNATGIDTTHLFKPDSASAAAKMSWASCRETTRPEDIAYCLLGLFNVNMPLLYGEGASKAFGRLQHEILRSRDDESIFAWLTQTGNHQGRGLLYSGMLAPSPECFFRSGSIVCIELPNSYGPRVTVGGFGISMKLSFKMIEKMNDRGLELKEAGYDNETGYHANYIAPLACANKDCESSPLKLHLQQLSPRTMARLQTSEFGYIAKGSLGHYLDTRTFHVNYNFHDEIPGYMNSIRNNENRTLAFAFRLSLEAQRRLSFRGVDGDKRKLLSTSTGDDGRLSVTAKMTSTLRFQHRRNFMVGFTTVGLTEIFVHIERELLYTRNTQSIPMGFGKSISVPLGDEEVLWISSKYGCGSFETTLVIVDVDITSKDKVDRESIL